MTAALGMPIATAEGEVDDAQGNITLFFHENEDKHGNSRARVFGVSNRHVLRERTTTKYKFKGPGSPRQYVRVTEIKVHITGHGINAELLTREIVEFKVKLKSDELEEAAEAKAAVVLWSRSGKSWPK